MSAVLDQPQYLVRAMHADDLDDVSRVERRGYDHPWSDSILRDCLRVGYNCWVCVADETIVAHAVMSIAVGEAHLLNLCVDPDWQGRGVGRRLLRRMFRVAVQRNADTLFLEVRESNAAALALYASEGFVEIGQRRGYYPAVDGREDALVYAKTLI
jgi:ribosomal-protein-alanine N-acetyltransferase